VAKIDDPGKSKNSEKIPKNDKKFSNGNKGFSDEKVESHKKSLHVEPKNAYVKVQKMGDLGDQKHDSKELEPKTAENPLTQPLAHHSPNSPKSPKSPNSPKSPTHPKFKLTNIDNKDKIIITILNKPKTIKDIGDELKLDLKSISRLIKRGDRESGLLFDGLVEKRIIDNKPHYVASSKGVEYINFLIEREQERERFERARWESHHETLVQINAFKNFIEGNYLDELLENSRKGIKYLIIDFNELSKQHLELADILLENPDEVIKAAVMAIEQIELPNDSKGYFVRFKNLPKSQTLDIRDIRSEHIGEFRRFEGTVRQKSDVRPQVTSSRFECPSCGTVTSVLQLDKKMREPTKCGCGRKGKFKLLSKELVDAQALVLEENLESIDGSEQPKKIKSILKSDLVSPIAERKAIPGSKVIINGIVKEVPITLRTGGQSTTFDLLIESNYLEPVDEEFEALKISKEEEAKIKKLSKEENIISKLVNSIAPNICGHDRIKEALLAQLLGGVQKSIEGRNTRADMHILLIGDPGTGKTELLKRIDQIAPKSRFVSGKGASGAGLTATVVKDEFIGGWALEAGTLVLTNKGLLCLDELDKISSKDTNAMHEALEGQIVTIAKANIQATLKCETTVLAAANPKMGRFDPYSRTIAEQIDLPSTLINRFDLIFPIKDEPDVDIDEEHTDFLLNIHKDANKAIKTDIDTKVLRKYIAYARKLKPRLTKLATNHIKKYYLAMRASGNGINKFKTIAISKRQLQGIIRISEAFAKARLSNTVGVLDAERATELVGYCLREIAYDKETGTIDVDRITTGITAGYRTKTRKIKELITALEEESIKKRVNIQDLVEKSEAFGIDEEYLEKILKLLRKEGFIFDIKKGEYIKRL